MIHRVKSTPLNGSYRNMNELVTFSSHRPTDFWTMASYGVPNSDGFEFFLSKSGLVQLFYSNRKYRLVSELKSGMTSWRCTYKKCTASILFDGSAIIRCRGNHVCKEVSSKDEVNSPLPDRRNRSRKRNPSRKPDKIAGSFADNGDTPIFVDEYSPSSMHLYFGSEEEGLYRATQDEKASGNANMQQIYNFSILILYTKSNLIIAYFISTTSFEPLDNWLANYRKQAHYP